MKVKTHDECKNPDCKKVFKKYKTTDKYCSYACEKICNPPKQLNTPNKINRVSKKQAVENDTYSKVSRPQFLSKPENQYCVIRGPNCTNYATTVEHTMGRVGYADDWARENEIKLINDVRFFKAACNNCNLDLENNPELSKQHQLSKIHGGKKL